MFTLEFLGVQEVLEAGLVKVNLIAVANIQQLEIMRRTHVAASRLIRLDPMVVSA